MKKVFICLSGENILRNFVETKSFHKIEKKFDTTYFVNSSLKKYIFKNQNKKFIDISNYNNHITQKISKLFFFSNLNKSKSYKYRYLRLLPFYELYNSNNTTLVRFYNFFKSLFFNKKSLWHLLVLPVISLFFFKKYFYKKYHNEITIPLEIKKLLKKNKYNKIIFIIPSAGVDFLSIAIDKIKKEYNNVLDIIIINNWDNLSSKGGFWHKPNKLIVWGKASKSDAKKIFDLDKEVVCLGPPNYENYFKIRDKKILPIYNFKYILFSGPALQFDEIRVLKKLDIILDKKKFRNLKLVYRPHPFRQNRKSMDNFFNCNFKHIILDKDAKKYYMKDNTAKKNTKLKYYPSLLKNAEFVIAPLSSLLIESLIFYKKVLVILHDDEHHFTTPYRNFKNLDHLQILKKAKTLNFSYNLDDLETSIDKTIAKKYSKKRYSNFMKKIINEPKNYQGKLFELVDSL